MQEIPFDSERKRMTTIHRNDRAGASQSGFAYPPLVAIVKGAPDVVLELCGSMLDGGQVVALTHAMRGTILDQNRDMASDALRVLGVAFRPLDEIPSQVSPETVEKDLVFVGLLGMIDPPRPEVIEALKVAKGAGLRTVMVTGDYKDTAEAIARDIGLRTPNGLVLTGAEIDKLSDEELAARVDRLDVCCRVSPQHKTRIVEAFKARDHVVAMTGDGVNDAPALKRANIGVAMGITGTDVAKQTADMVLTDDNFASIVSAIEQGRIIYSNIRKFVYFLLACNVGEILIVFGAMLFGMPMPLRPVQLLWLNLVSDGAPALALGLEKGDDDIMKQPARSPKEPVINRDMAVGIGVVGIVDMIAILAVFYLAMQRYPGHLEAAQTMAFVTLCTSELIRAFAARSEYHSIFSIGFFSNRWMVAAVALSFVLVLAVVYVPFLAPFFDAVPLTADDWLLMLPFFFASPVAMELLKIYFRGRKASAGDGSALDRRFGRFRRRNAAGCGAGPATNHGREDHAEDPGPRWRHPQRPVRRAERHQAVHERHGDGSASAQRPDALLGVRRAVLEPQEPPRLPPRAGGEGARPGQGDAGQVLHSLCGAHGGGRPGEGDNGHGPAPALRRDSDGDGAQELAHAAGREFGHRQGDRAHAGAGRGHRGRLDVEVGALRHSGCDRCRDGDGAGDRGLTRFPIGRGMREGRPGRS